MPLATLLCVVAGMASQPSSRVAGTSPRLVCELSRGGAGALSIELRRRLTGPLVLVEPHLLGG